MSGWSWYWLLWLVGGFAVPETVALVRNPRDTLSDTVWGWFGVMRGQPISSWSVEHYVLLAFVIWLAGHIAFRIWR